MGPAHRVSALAAATAALVAGCCVTAAAALGTPAGRSALSAPVVSGVSPARGDTGGGTAVTVSGSGFTAAVTVSFGSTAATAVRIVGPTSLVATAPAHVAGAVDVRVRTGAGVSAVGATDRFVYAACTPQPVYFSGTITSDTTLTAACVSRYELTGPVTVAAGVTVTVQAGVTVAAEPGAGVTVDGTLDARGTSAAPVVFTSAGAAQAGAWPGITVDAGGAADLAGTTLRYATTALQTATGTDVRIRGQILDSTLGVQAPDATAAPGGVVDARGVWWGSADGPAPVGSGTAVQGSGVVVTPWTGLVLPSRPATARADTTPPTSTACSDVLFLGARGSGEAPQGTAIDDPATTDRQLLGPRVAPVLDAMTAALPARTRVRVVGLRYAAVPPRYAAPSTFDLGYYDAVWAGVDQLESTLAREHGRCPNERIVLAGYSQGALVVHLALAELAARGTLARYPVAAVELVADPARTSTDRDVRVGTAASADSGVWGVATGRPVPLPVSVVSRTAEICHADDAVCDTAHADGTLDDTAYAAPHASYPVGDELSALGRHAAARLT